MIRALVDVGGTLGILGLIMHGLVFTMWSASNRLGQLEGTIEDAPQVAIAMAAEEDYCTPRLEKVLRRVLKSCGLMGSGGSRGCQPTEAKTVATMSGADFNELFDPLAERAGIIQFDVNSADLDLPDRALLGTLFSNQKGASYFLVVARASPEGSQLANRDLSKARGQAVLEVLQASFDREELDEEVGLLWLGEEFAQLDEDFCDWRRSGSAEECDETLLNRSAFVTWVDCRL